MPVLKGLDTTMELTRHALALKETNGFDFVLRYYSHHASKNLSLGEARALSDVNLQIGVVWETLGLHASFFSYAQGLADGSAAFQIARNQIGQPIEAPIYFAVDFNATQADLEGPISAYFSAIRDVFVLAAKGEPNYPIGVYGSGLCCSYLLDKQLATFSWLSQSRDYTGSTAFKAEGRYNLVQTMPATVKLDDGATMQIDPNETNPNRPTGLFTL
jgi:hypothetical protein